MDSRNTKLTAAFLSIMLVSGCVSQPKYHNFSGQDSAAALKIVTDNREVGDKVTASTPGKNCQHVIGDDFIHPSPLLILESKLSNQHGNVLEDGSVVIRSFRITQCSNVPGRLAKGHTAVLSEDGAILFGALGLPTTSDVLRCTATGIYRGKELTAYESEVFEEATFGSSMDKVVGDCTNKLVLEISNLIQ